MSPLLEKVKSFLTEQRLSAGPVVVAVSGGPDSVALLLALASLREQFALWPLVLAHLNHKLRGAESEDDQAFVHDLYLKHQATAPESFLWRVHGVDVRAAGTAGVGIEGTARAIRYEWLAAVARESGATWVATGHTADDQAETVLHRLLRGTGIRGLAGISQRRALAPDVEVIRPLLEVTRQEVLDFLNAQGQPFREDSSNRDPKFMRNRLRHELLPLLRNYNPAVVSVLCRLACQADSLHQEEEARGRELLQRSELPRAGSLLVFDHLVLKSTSRHEVCGMFRLVWTREGWPQQHMGFKEWHRLARVARGETRACDLPGPIRARHRGKIIQVGPTSKPGG